MTLYRIRSHCDKRMVFAPNQKMLWRGLRNIVAWHINSLAGQASGQLYDCYSYLTKGRYKIFLQKLYFLQKSKPVFFLNKAFQL